MIKSNIKNLLKKAVKMEGFELEVFVSEKDDFGHYSTNAALKLAKIKSENPMAIAEKIKAALSDRIARIFFQKIEVAAPGFINFWLSEKVLQNELKEILKRKEKYGKTTLRQAQGKKIQIEFISANPTGPLTLANGRGGFMGDVLSNILEFLGYKIEREYYINDTGNQILTLGKSILAALGLLEEAHLTGSGQAPLTGSGQENFYKGGYVKEWAYKNSLKVKKFKNNPMKVGQMAAADFLKEIKLVIKKAGINFNRWTSEEKDIHKKSFIKKMLEIFKKTHLASSGQAHLASSGQGLTYEKDGALWLKTTDFGDEKDRVLITKDKFPTYFLADSGHFLETKNRGFDKKIMILGPDHYGYVNRAKAAAKILGFENLEIIITQAMRLMSGNEEVKMSKRSGEFITFEELLKEVGIDAARFFFLTHSPETHMDFDLDLAKEHSMKNPVYYVQYAAVRCQSIIKKVSSIKYQVSNVDFKLLNTKEDLNLMRILARFSEVVNEAGEKYNPQILARYSLELARQFHNFYEKERIIGEKKNLMLARLELIKATQIIFKNIFKLLGIAMPKKM
ncbi:arginine--tRNA ligase [Candidatus Wolfebacteria bacterium]|nr:arginine--tRNA ligase [Candidatus Wolfebacteria bacterium]